MDYRTIVNRVQNLGFIKDKPTADRAIKTVLGTITSKLPDDKARTFADNLPDQLSYEELRRPQTISGNVSLPEYIQKIGQQFNIDESKARELVFTVMRSCEEVVGRERFQQVSQSLPSDWVDAFRTYEPANPNYFPGSESKRKQ